MSFLSGFSKVYRGLDLAGPARLGVLGLMLWVPAGCSSASGQGISLAPPNRSGSVPYFGAFLGDVTEDRLQELKLTEIRGAVVGRIIEDSPAAKAGIRAGDVVLKFRGEMVEGREHFFRLLTASSPGRLVTLTISRDGASQNIHVTLSERRGAAFDDRSRLFSESDEIRRAAEQFALEAEEARQKGDTKAAEELATRAATLKKQAEEGRAEIERQIAATADRETRAQSSYSVAANRHLLGVSVRPLNPQLAGVFHVPEGTGLLVTEVKPGGLVDRAGIKAGDCITSLNGQRTNSLQDLTRQTALAARQGENTEIVFSVIRDGKEMTAKSSLAR